MIWALLVLHLVACGLLVASGSRLGRRSLLVAAIPPAVTAGWAVTRIGAEEAATASRSWVPGLDLELAFAVDSLATLMTLLVSGIGALVF
ncbi:MAG: hypothetical protein AAGA65_30210, partial [Actinomycetota bacterium]